MSPEDRLDTGARSGPLWPTRRRDVVVLAACGALAWLGLRGGRVPLLSAADLGLHELGHLVCYVLDAFLPVPALITAAAGSGLQIAVPLALAGYFGWWRRDRAGAAVCLVWGATASADVARYVADAPVEGLPLIGGQHDWAFILGPDGLDRLDAAVGLASVFDGLGWLLATAALVLTLLPLLRWLLSGEPPSDTAGATGEAAEPGLRFPV